MTKKETRQEYSDAGKLKTVERIDRRPQSDDPPSKRGTAEVEHR
jgi:hypothetical protein